MLTTMRSEWLKLTTTASWWVTTPLIVLSALAIAFLGVQDLLVTEPQGVLYGFYGMGFPLLAIQAVLLVTSEFRTRLFAVTVLATPNRLKVIFAKLATYALFAAAVVAVTIVIIYAGAEAFASSRSVPMFGGEGMATLLANVLVAVFYVVFAMGLGMILRSTTGAIVLLLLWMGVAEPMLAGLFALGADPGYPWLPFLRAQDFLFEGWSQAVSGAYFAAWAIGVFAIGTALTLRRDA